MGQSREERSGLRNLLRCDEAEGNPPRGSDFKKLGSLGMKTQGPSVRGLFVCDLSGCGTEGEAIFHHSAKKFALRGGELLLTD